MKRSVSSASQGSSLDLLAAVSAPPSSPDKRAARETHLQALKVLKTSKLVCLEVWKLILLTKGFENIVLRLSKI